MSWANPEAFALLLLGPLMLIVWRHSRRPAGLPLSTLSRLAPPQGLRARVTPVLMWVLRLSCLSLLVLALARPQEGYVWEEERQWGIDIMLALDISGSMRAEDFQPTNRLVAAKQVLADFVAKSGGNRLGLVIFAGRSITQVPLTTDHEMLATAIKQVDFDSVRQDGTAIGDAIGNSLYRLREANAKGRVIVLFTDGENNSGYLDPMQAAAMAAVKGVRVHTIAVGRPGGAPVPILNAWGEKVYLQDAEGKLVIPPINEETLKRIAEATGGRYFRATDTEALRRIYDEINQLEKSPIEVKRHIRHEERFWLFLLPGLALLALELALSSWRWRVLRLA